MEDKKTVFKFFTIFQYQQEEEFLSSMHAKGWKLAKITFPGFYHFNRCQPQNVTYRLDYTQKGIQNKTDYIQMFSDCGWGYLFDFAGYSYFYKESTNSQEQEEIFCDDESRLDMMKRVFKGRIIPLIILSGPFLHHFHDIGNFIFNYIQRNVISVLSISETNIADIFRHKIEIPGNHHTHLVDYY